jgi:hypothetical protein
MDQIIAFNFIVLYLENELPFKNDEEFVAYLLLGN